MLIKKNINKILKTIILGIFVCCIISISNIAYAQEKIDNFDVIINVNKDSSILITEKINYDFGSASLHGIFRDIPVKYKTLLGNKSIDLIVESVTRDGSPEDYVLNNKGSSKEIKIGNATTSITGEHIYNIIYRVKNAIGYFDGNDEVYWNATGNSWPVAISNSSIKIELPNGTDFSKTSSDCYIGILGSKEKCDINIKDNFISVSNSRLLQPSEGITIAIDFPKGLVYQPSKIENIISTIKDNIVLVLPIFTFLIMFFVWRKNGKDPKGYTTIIAQYEPPENMKPTLVGSLVDESVDNRDITSGLIYLAEQGYVFINRIEKEGVFSSVDYELELVKIDTGTLEKTEKNILDLFFEELTLGKKVKMSSFTGKRTFMVKYKEIVKDTYQEMTDRGFYEKNPNKAKAPYIGLSIATIFIGVFLFAKFLSILGIASFVLSGIIIFIFGLLMSKKTKLGSDTRDYILGFKDFLSVTEKDRLNFHNAPEKNPEQFMKFLPYAIALGVEKKWAKQFDGIFMAEPTWYHSSNIGTFVAVDFVSHMSGFSQSFNGAATMSGGAGGGGAGFSGGGGGGGGGGSW